MIWEKSEVQMRIQRRSSRPGERTWEAQEAVIEEIEIRASQEGPEEKRRPLAALIFLAAGIYGVLALFQSLKGISFAEWAVYPAAALLCWVIWYTYYGENRRAFWLLICGSVVAYGGALLWMEDVFGEQIRYIAGCVIGGLKLEPMDVTEAVLLLTALLIFFAAMSEFMVRSHTLLYFLTTLLLLLSPLWGMRAGAGAMLLLALFQASFWVMQTAGAGGWRLSFEGGVKSRTLSRSSFVAGLVLAVLFGAVFLAVSVQGDGVYDIVYETESRIYRTVSRLTGNSSRTVRGGAMNRGNVYRLGTPHLVVETDAKPTETLYLRGFEGAEYIGGGWSESGDGTLFEDIEKELGWQMYADGLFQVSNLYHSMYFMMNSNMDTEGVPDWRNMRISHVNGEYTNMYVPYYSQRSWGWGGTFQEGYMFWYYEQKDMHIAWDQVYEEFMPLRDMYQVLQEAYMEEAQITYTQVPVHILTRLSNLCQENPQESLEEITAFILYTLHENAEYTMAPGWTPLNEDMVEYFLFESGRGYCEHFATAAVLMYRLYGIPARYAAGYVVQPSAFTQQEEGSWKAVVTDEEAHAWAEIFLEDYGWTPVEVTPMSTGESAAMYPGFDTSIFRKLVHEKGWDREQQKLRTQTENYAETGWQISGDLFDWEIDLENDGKWLSAMGACALYTICLIPFFLDYRRLRRLKKLEKSGSRRIFSCLLEMLRFAGILEGYDGTEADFASKLTEMTGVSEIKIRDLVRIVEEAAYGAEPSSAEGDACVWQVYCMLAASVYRKLKWHKKGVFRYWKAFF